MFASLSHGQVYEDQLKLKKAKQVEKVLLQNNGEDVRLIENKVSHECKTPKGKVLAIKKKLKASTKIKGRGEVECGEKMSGERNKK
jgi:sulfur transfer complex TusBCD TusB component (DsrH family)